tara:strand:+ start:182 stop:361 length:180 start_codon:yes stop_codon:yes gene_type:complete
MRVKLVPKTRWAREYLRNHMRSPYMFVDDRREQWKVGNPSTGINFWVHPTKDKNWEVIR